MSQSEGNGWRAHLSKNGVYVNLRALVGEHKFFHACPEGYTFRGISLYVGTGYDGGAAWVSQPGGPVELGTAYTIGAMLGLPSGAIPSYHFLDDGADNITVIAEYSAGVYQHMGWGNLLKAGAFTGGAYFFASCDFRLGAATACAPCSDSSTTMDGFSSAYFRADVDSFTGKWLNMVGLENKTGKNARSPFCNYNARGSGIWTALPYYGLSADDRPFGFQSAQVSLQNNRITLLPARIFVDRDSYGVSLLGTVPGLFYTTATDHGFDKASELQIGSDSYLLFPDFAVKKVG